MRRLIASVAVLAVVGLAGCYGSTEPATDIGLHDARLHGAGTTNNGQASVFFQFWPSAYPARVRETLRTDVPGDRTGPFSQFTRVQLALDTQYSFRLCGDEGGGPICAQTRTFRMPTPTGDAVMAQVDQAYGFRPLVIEAQSDRSGGSPTGFLSVTGAFAGSVTSVTVAGNRAVVYAKGTAQQSVNTFNAEACAEVSDAGPGAPVGSGDFADVQIALTDLGQTVGCVLLPSDSTGDQDGVSVYDAP